MKRFCIWCLSFHNHAGNIGYCKKKGGEKDMTKNVKRTSRTPEERFALKVDKIISTLIQMKPMADSPEKKTVVFGQLKYWLEYLEALEVK